MSIDEKMDAGAAEMLKDPAVVALIDSLRLRLPHVGRGFFEQAFTICYKRGYVDANTSKVLEAISE